MPRRAAAVELGWLRRVLTLNLTFNLNLSGDLEIKITNKIKSKNRHAGLKFNASGPMGWAEESRPFGPALNLSRGLSISNQRGAIEPFRRLRLQARPPLLQSCRSFPERMIHR